MDNALILLVQVVMMFLLAVMGYLMFRFKKITLEGSKSLGNILIYLSLPAVIINSFLRDGGPEMLRGLLISAGAALVTLVISVVVSTLFFKQDGIAKFASAFSNPGFFGIPLINGLLGNGAVFYVAFYIAFLNILQWTWGVSVMTGQKGKVSVKRVLTAPFIIGMLIGLVFFLFKIPRPALVTNLISLTAGLNTPLAMFVIGIYLAQTNVGKMFKKGKLYLVSLVRLIVIPVLCFGVLSLLSASMNEIRVAVLIAAACPVVSNVAVYAQLHDQDYGYAVETVVISTMLSIVTIPVLMSIAMAIWG